MWRSWIVNIGLPNEPSFRYGNFFIPWTVGPREVRFSIPRANFNIFFIEGMKKFWCLKLTAHLEIVFLQELTKWYFYFMLQFGKFFQTNKKYSVGIKKIIKLRQFRFTVHAEIGFQHGHAEVRFLFINATTIWKCMEICQWPLLILTHTRIPKWF